MSESLPMEKKREAQKMARRAIAELFLDTELTEADFIRIRDALLETKLSIAELDLIYYNDMAPLLYSNLDSTAGEWSGFDSEWIETQVAKRRGQHFLENIPGLSALRRFWTTRTTQKDWLKIKHLLE